MVLEILETVETLVSYTFRHPPSSPAKLRLYGKVPDEVGYI